MINDIVKSIGVALNAEFGDQYRLYAEGVRKGLEAPCFSISCINATYDLFLGKRYFCANQFCIQYLPPDGEKPEECHAVAERLHRCLEWITVDGSFMRGSKMNHKLEDGILHFLLNYDFFVRREDPLETMGTVTENINVKG